jgi:hypothetical protein
VEGEIDREGVRWRERGGGGEWRGKREQRGERGRGGKRDRERE